MIKPEDVRAQRKAQGLTQAQFAERCGVSENTVRLKWERTGIPDKDIKKAIAIIKLDGWRLREHVEEEPKPPKHCLCTCGMMWTSDHAAFKHNYKPLCNCGNPIVWSDGDICWNGSEWTLNAKVIKH